MTRVLALWGLVLGSAGVLGCAMHSPHPEAAQHHTTLAHHLKRKLSVTDIREHIGDPKQLHWTKAAHLFIDGIESCVDGRDRHAVIGTPGGDAGELVLSLTAVEEWTGHRIDRDEVELLFEAHLEAFGDFYMHTDHHAIMALGELLRDDPAFEEIELRTAADIEAIVRRPPAPLQERLIKHLIDHRAIGCGHLGLMAKDPGSYRVRPELLHNVIEAFFERLWQNNEHLRYEVLDGEHEEGAILNVLLAEQHVHPYTKIPMIEPDIRGTEVFVNHPQVARWLRQERVRFLLETDPWLQTHDIDLEGFVEAVQDLADVHLGLTATALAPTLPIFNATVGPDNVVVTR